jgi:LPPG:FO 2-phospho-L-lactate transferase
VGGARLARGIAAATAEATVIVNVGDDDEVYGLNVSPDLDTVLYTLAGMEGDQGWGVSGDTFTAMDRIAGLGIDTSFRIGDLDLATNLVRTTALAGGEPLSVVTARIATAFGIGMRVLPATDGRLHTRVLTTDGDWLDFQDYFVRRRHEDEVAALRFEGAENAVPAPGVTEAVATAAAVIIGPSNPPLSIWPILAVPGIREAVAAAPRVIAVSPLFAGQALKGPAHRVMDSLGLPSGNLGVIAAYDDLISDIVIDKGDSADVSSLAPYAKVHVADTRFGDQGPAAIFARYLVSLL